MILQMPMQRLIRHGGKVALAAALIAAMSATATAQTLADIEVKLVREITGGCIDPCPLPYTVTIRGDGAVQYDGPQGHHTRTVSPDDALALVNEFIQARFFTALDKYEACCGTLVRHGDTVELGGMAGGADAPYAALTLKIGARTKTVILRENYPPELGRLPDLVDRLGGPAIWR